LTISSLGFASTVVHRPTAHATNATNAREIPVRRRARRHRARAPSRSRVAGAFDGAHIIVVIVVVIVGIRSTDVASRAFESRVIATASTDSSPSSSSSSSSTSRTVTSNIQSIHPSIERSPLVRHDS
jgi:hypothetical protein